MAKKTYDMIARSPIHLGKMEADGERDHRGLFLPNAPFQVFTAKKRDRLIKAGLARLDVQSETSSTDGDSDQPQDQQANQAGD